MRPAREGTARWYAERINAHLKRMENDLEINVKRGDRGTTGGGIRRFYHATAFEDRSKVKVAYLSFQGSSELTREEAATYLAALDAGDTRRHFEVLREEGQ